MAASTDHRSMSSTDRGYAWVVLFAVSMATFLDMGNFKTFGVYYVTFLEEFRATAAVTSLTAAVYSVLYSFIALPVDATLVERFSCRQVIMVGGASATLALVFNSLASGIEIIIFSNGILLAIGSACVHGPCMIILGQYFDRRRGMSNSLAVACGSMGGLVLPVVFTLMMEEFGLRGALLLQGGIMSHCVLAGALSRPTELTRKFQEEERKKKMQENYEKRRNDNEDPNALKSLVDAESYDTTHDVKLVNFSSDMNGSNGLIKQTDENHSKKGCSSISEYSSACDLPSASLTDLQAETERIQKERKGILQKCQKFIDLSILKSKLIVLFTVVFFTGNVCSVLAQIFIPPLARDRGVPEHQLGTIAAVIAASEFISKIILAFITDLKFLERYRILMCAFIINGTTLQFTRLPQSFSHFVVFAAVYGLFSGTMHSIYAPICVDFVGVDRFHKALGFLHLGQGIMGGLMGFLGGVLRDYSGGYDVGFHVMGGMGIFAGCLLMLVPCVRQRDNEAVK